MGLVLLAANWEVFRLGFFADDFHFLDVAVRASLPDLLLGKSGIYPWFRPLSRELPFLLIARTGEAAPFLAHALTLGAMAAATLALFQLGARWLEPRWSPLPALLFAVAGVSKFLAGWASGLQDLLALALVLHSVRAMADRRGTQAILLAALASFAKETGILAFPLLALLAILIAPERPLRRWWIAWGAGALAVLAIHVAVRTTWPGGIPPIGGGASDRSALADALITIAGWFVPLSAGPVGVAAIISALVAGGAAFVLLRGTPGPGPAGAPRTRPARRALWAFVLTAGALGSGFLVAAASMSWSRPHAYYAFPALPWALFALALALESLGPRVPRRALPIAVSALVALQVWSAGFRSVNLDRPVSWLFRRWDWNEAVRLSAVSERMAGDLRFVMRGQPADAVVLYNNLPKGSLFQTEDGPATRVALGKPRVRAYYLGEAALDLPLDRIVMLRFDTSRLRLAFEERDLAENVARSIMDLIDERPGSARAWTAWVPADRKNDFNLASMRSRAFLIGEGPSSFLRALAEAGLDSTGTRIDDVLGESFAGDAAPLRAPAERALRHPTSAAAHAEFADSLIAWGATSSGVLQLKLALALDPSRTDLRLRFARLIAGSGSGRDAMARRELERVLATATDSATAQDARAALSALGPPDPSSSGRSTVPAPIPGPSPRRLPRAARAACAHRARARAGGADRRRGRRR